MKSKCEKGFWMLRFAWALVGLLFMIFGTGCVVGGDYAPQLNASIGTGGASSHPYIADDLTE